MKELTIKCKKINGTNGVFTKTGDHTVVFTGIVPTGINESERFRFIVTNVGYTDKFLNAYFYAREYVEYIYNGYLFDTHLESQTGPKIKAG